MNKKSGEYPLSTNTTIIIGALGTVLGPLVWTIGAVGASGFALLGVVMFLVGLPTLISGLIRESRERKAARELR